MIWFVASIAVGVFLTNLLLIVLIRNVISALHNLADIGVAIHEDTDRAAKLLEWKT